MSPSIWQFFFQPRYIRNYMPGISQPLDERKMIKFGKQINAQLFDLIAIISMHTFCGSLEFAQKYVKWSWDGISILPSSFGCESGFPRIYFHSNGNQGEAHCLRWTYHHWISLSQDCHGIKCGFFIFFLRLQVPRLTRGKNRGIQINYIFFKLIGAEARSVSTSKRQHQGVKSPLGKGGAPGPSLNDAMPAFDPRIVTSMYASWGPGGCAIEDFPIKGVHFVPTSCVKTKCH